MSKMPVAGNAWLAVQYLLGFQRLGYDVYYVEAHGCTPRELMEHEHDNGCLKAARYIERILRRFDLHQNWAYHARHAGGDVYGMTKGELFALYRSAELIINLHGATIPRPEQSATGRLILLETDPVALQIELYEGQQTTIDYLAPHVAFFTFGELYGTPGCRLPVSERFVFRPTRQPVVLDYWQPYADCTGDAFTTIGNWRQDGRDVSFQGERYQWSKHYEFLKFLEVPTRTRQTFELALSRYSEDEAETLTQAGWRVRPAGELSTDPDVYRGYIARSYGEFTVAKDQNVRLRSGWFSDRSATYLAAGRPVVTQETGFSDILPTGAGLFSFTTLDDVAQAVACIRSDYAHHRTAAAQIARECFSHEVVLGRLLADVGV